MNEPFQSAGCGVRCGTDRVRDEEMPHIATMSYWMLLGKVISKVVHTTFPENTKVALTDAVTRPVKPHIDGFGHAFLDGLVGQSDSTLVITLHGCGSLRVPKVGKCCA